MPIYNSTYFQESALAHELLDGLKGLEIGGGMHNAFGLDTLNVDRVPVDHPDFAPYASEQIRLGNINLEGSGKVMPVDIVAPGNCIPVDDLSFDFVISSHVIEHFYDPIGAIKEWMRIAKQYIFINCPQRDALESDREKPLTELAEHTKRFSIAASINEAHLFKGEKRRIIDSLKTDFEEKANTDEHHSRWTPESFCDMCMWICNTTFGRGWNLHKWIAVDDKVHNGFCVVLKREYFMGTPGPELHGDIKPKRKKSDA